MIEARDKRSYHEHVQLSYSSAVPHLETIKSEAARYGVNIVGSEIVA